LLPLQPQSAKFHAVYLIGYSIMEARRRLRGGFPKHAKKLKMNVLAMSHV
jgi:hypothetical protein